MPRIRFGFVYLPIGHGGKPFPPNAATFLICPKLTGLNLILIQMGFGATRGHVVDMGSAWREVFINKIGGTLFRLGIMAILFTVASDRALIDPELIFVVETTIGYPQTDS